MASRTETTVVNAAGTESQANALIGVFISVTTIPAAADVGVSSALHAGNEALGSLFQLLLNVGLLIVVGSVALRLQRKDLEARRGQDRDNATGNPNRLGQFSLTPPTLSDTVDAHAHRSPRSQRRTCSRCR